MGVSIVAVTTRRQLTQFVELPYSLYVAAPHWVPPLRRDERRRLSRAHNPFLEHADMAMWIAEDNGRVVGRVAAIDDRLHNETHGERATWFGFFEAEDEQAARPLMAAVDAWATARGSHVIRGPANPSLNESAGLLVNAFDEDPYVLMPYNPPEYEGFLLGSGYVKAKDLLAWRMDSGQPVNERIARHAERARRRQAVLIRPVDLKHFDRDLDHLKTIYRAAWQDNWGFVPPTDSEIRQLAIDLRPILDPEIALFAEVHGQTVGCAIAIPDANQVLKRMKGRLLPFGLVHFLRRRAIINQARVILLGVLPEFRKTGIFAVLTEEMHTRAVARGYLSGELSWTLEDNHDVNAGIVAAGGRRSKTYRLYERRLAVPIETQGNLTGA